MGRVHHVFVTDDVELVVSLFPEDGEYDQFRTMDELRPRAEK